MSANRKRQRSDSVAVHVLSKKAKQASPEVDRSVSAKEDGSASAKEDKSVVPGDEESAKPSGAFVYTSPKIDAQSSAIYLFLNSMEVEERQVNKAWPRAAVREIWARIKNLPEDAQEDKLEELYCIESFPLVQVGHFDEKDAEGGEGGKMYDRAIEAMKGADDEHSGWQEFVLQREKPSGDAPALELELDGEPEGVEDPGRPYHGRWWWVSSQPAGAEDEQAIKKLEAANLGERTGMWTPGVDDEGVEEDNARFQ